MNAPRSALAGNGVRRAGLAYLTAGFVVFLLMGLLGLVMRLVQAGWVPLAPEWFYRVMTLHGSGMIAGIMLAAMGGYAAALGAQAPLAARWLWVAFGVYLLGALLVILATTVGKLATGWTVLYPLPFEGKSWGLRAAATMYAGYALVGAGFLVYCLSVLVATSKAAGGLRRALAWEYLFSGGRSGSDRLPTPVALVGTVVALDGILAVAFGVAYLLGPFLGTGPLGERMDPLLAKNILMVFGHTFANLTIYLAAGTLYATLPHYTGREWKTSWPLALALNLVIVLVLMPVFHHLYQDFAQPVALQYVGQIGSYAVGIPAVVVTILGALALVYRSPFKWAVPSILIALGLWGWVFGGIGAVLDGTIGINQVMHNTLWVPAHFHTYYILGALAFVVGYYFHLTAELSGRPESATSRLMAWVFGVGAAGFLMMFFISGANSVPRRFAVHLPEWQRYARIAALFVVAEAVGLAWIAFDILARIVPAWRRETP